MIRFKIGMKTLDLNFINQNNVEQSQNETMYLHFNLVPGFARLPLP